MTIRGGGDPNTAMASMPLGEWARRLGALPPKRMTASWSGSHADPTEYKDVAQCFAPRWRAPLGRFGQHTPPDLLVTGNLLDTLITEETPKAA